MDKNKCKECGKEINQKAEICPHCGCRVKSNIPKFIAINIIVLLVIVLSFFAIITIKELLKDHKEENIRDLYVGTWTLQNKEDVYYTAKSINEFDQDRKYKLILDESLTFEEEDVSWHLGNDRYCHNDQKIEEPCNNQKATVHLSTKKDEVAIDFVDEYGMNILLCFALIDENTLKQRTCMGIALDDINPNAFSVNGGIDEELGIIYKKK